MRYVLAVLCFVLATLTFSVESQAQSRNATHGLWGIDGTVNVYAALSIPNVETQNIRQKMANVTRQAGYDTTVSAEDWDVNISVVGYGIQYEDEILYFVRLRVSRVVTLPFRKHSFAAVVAGDDPNTIHAVGRANVQQHVWSQVQSELVRVLRIMRKHRDKAPEEDEDNS